MPRAPVVRVAARGAAYCERRFRHGAEGTAHWWAVAEGTKIGFAKIDLGEDHDGRWAQVRDFFVAPAWCRRGYGSAFARALIGGLVQQGIDRIDLTVRVDNPREFAFWQRQGFELARYHLRMYPNPNLAV